MEAVLGLGEEPGAVLGGEAPAPESPPSIIILDDEGTVAPEEQPAAVPEGG